MSWFGDSDLPLQKRLDTAFLDFKAFCKARQISCSQPPFSVKLALWKVYVFCLSGLSLLVLYVNVCAHRLIHPCCVTAKIVKKHNEILMTAKAYNNRCILEWLAHVLGQARVNAADDRISMMFLAMMLAQTDRGCLCRKATNSCLRAVVPRHAFWQRNSMARFMGMLERAGRFLPLGKTNAACVPV